jgi:hypothetical protein
MKRLISVFFWAGFFMASSSAQVLFSNVLQNPGFEQGASDTSISNWFRWSNAYRYTGGARSGSYALCTWGPFIGAWDASGVYQEVPASEGQNWEATIWARTTESPQGEAFAALNLNYVNASDQVIGEIKSVKRIDASTPTGTWFKLTVRGRTTRNTVKLRVVPLFVQSPANETGSAWFDDCALYQVPTTRVDFAGRRWDVWDCYATPGPNFFSTNCVWVDEAGALHLDMKKIDDVWQCGTVEYPYHLGFGEYRWYVGSRVDLVDTNTVVGLFTYDQESDFGTNQNEVDIEFSSAFDPSPHSNLLYTIQPWNVGANGFRMPLELTNDITTHRFIWRPDQVHYQSYYGHTPEPYDTNLMIAEWIFRERGIPIETNERTYMNFWIYVGRDAPTDTQHVEVILNDFCFNRFDGVILRDTFTTPTLSNGWAQWQAGSLVLTNGSLQAQTGADTLPVGLSTTGTIHRNERGQRYVFSALCRTVTVTQARTGDDCTLLNTLCSSTGTAWQADCAAIWRADYDQDADRLTCQFYVKTNAPNSDGTLLFEGEHNGWQSAVAGQAVALRMELDPTNYHVGLYIDDDVRVAFKTNSGAADGQHDLREALNYGYWFFGVQNPDSDCRSTVIWDEAQVGIADQYNDLLVTNSWMETDQLNLQWPSSFATRYDVLCSTNLAHGFLPVETNIVAQPPVNVYTDSTPAASASYTIRARATGD